MLPILRLTFLELSCNFRKFGLKKRMGIFFSIRRFFIFRTHVVWKQVFFIVLFKLQGRAKLAHIAGCTGISHLNRHSIRTTESYNPFLLLSKLSLSCARTRRTREQVELKEFDNFCTIGTGSQRGIGVREET